VDGAVRNSNATPKARGGGARAQLKRSWLTGPHKFSLEGHQGAESKDPQERCVLVTFQVRSSGSLNREKTPTPAPTQRGCLLYTYLLPYSVSYCYARVASAPLTPSFPFLLASMKRPLHISRSFSPAVCARLHTLQRLLVYAPQREVEKKK